MTARETTEVSKLLEAGARSKSLLYSLHSFINNIFSLKKYKNKKFSSGSHKIPVIIKKKGVNTACVVLLVYRYMFMQTIFVFFLGTTCTALP
jgi:hypothetical protein